jgi:hypothetical protein
MFKLRLEQYVTCVFDGQNRTKSLWIYKDIELPFVPYPGLTINDRGTEDKLENLYWMTDGQQFYNKLPDEHIECRYAKSAQECLENRLSYGWYMD